jgi:hypothetical protein
MTDAAFYQLGPLREYLEDPTVLKFALTAFRKLSVIRSAAAGLCRTRQLRQILLGTLLNRW